MRTSSPSYCQLHFSPELFIFIISTVCNHGTSISVYTKLNYSSSPTHHFIPNSIHSCVSRQTSQTLNLKNIHFRSVSTSLIPNASAPYNAVGTITPSYRRFFSFISSPLYCSAHCSALAKLNTPHSFCVPHPFHVLHHLTLATVGT